MRSRPERTTIFSFLLISILLISISSYTILRIEQNSPGSNITNVGEAYWWTLVTITTVGYGDYYPVTNNGRIVALILMLTGIGLFSAFTSYLSSSFVNRRNRKLKRGNDKIAIRLAAIEDQLRELTEEIRNNPPDSKKDDS